MIAPRVRRSNFFHATATRASSICATREGYSPLAHQKHLDRPRVHNLIHQPRIVLALSRGSVKFAFAAEQDSRVFYFLSALLIQLRGAAKWFRNALNLERSARAYGGCSLIQLQFTRVLWMRKDSTWAIFLLGMCTGAGLILYWPQEWAQWGIHLWSYKLWGETLPFQGLRFHLGVLLEGNISNAIKLSLFEISLGMFKGIVGKNANNRPLQREECGMRAWE